MRTYNHNISGYSWLIPVSGGAFVAFAATFILRQGYVWALLVTFGLAVFVLSLAVRDFKSYWLAVFALSLPLEIKKSFIDSDYLREVVSTYSFPIGALPAPVLYLSDLPFIVLMLCWLFEITYKKQRIYFPKSNLMAIFFVGWAGISLIKAPVLSYAFFDLMRLIKLYFIYLYAANNILSRTEVKTLINFFLLGVVSQGFICLYQFLGQDVSYIFGNLFGQQDLYSEETRETFQTFFSVYESSDINIKRASGTVGAINGEAKFFEFLLPVAMLLWLTAKKFWSQALNLFVFVVGSVGLILTFSRGGLIGLIAGLATALLFAWIYRVISSKKFLVVLIACLFFGTTLIPKLYQYITARPEATIARFHSIKVGIEIIKDNPILGVGLNSHNILSPKYDPDVYFMPMPTHNYFLLVATEIGIPGLVFFLGFLGLSCSLALKTARSEDLYTATVSIAIFAAFVGISVHVLADWIACNTNHTLLWLYAGLSAGLYRMKEMKK